MLTKSGHRNIFSKGNGLKVALQHFKHFSHGLHVYWLRNWQIMWQDTKMLITGSWCRNQVWHICFIFLQDLMRFPPHNQYDSALDRVKLNSGLTSMEAVGMRGPLEPPPYFATSWTCYQHFCVLSHDLSVSKPIDMQTMWKVLKMLQSNL